ncbi:hypothetical protein [Pseudomonas sp. CGJS7]|uniref:hypothetical protein n=1 Tax=Pseudomonas sp. CGJS7 TaxID=3109348 RepID=UPI00300B5D58
MQQIPTFKLVWQSSGIAQYSVGKGPVPLDLWAWIECGEGRARMWARARDDEADPRFRNQEERDLRCYTLDPELIAPLPALFEAVGAFSPQLEPLVAYEEEKPDYFEFHSFTGAIGERPFHFWLRFGTPGQAHTPLYHSLMSTLNKVTAAATAVGGDTQAR